MASSLLLLLLRLERRISHSSVTYNNNLFSRNLHTPRLMLPPVLEGPRKINYQLYNIKEKKVESLQQQLEEEVKEFKWVGSSHHGWLASFTSRDDNILLSNPLTVQHMKLPPLSHTILSEEEKEEVLKEEEEGEKVDEVDEGGFSVSKLILSHSPDDEHCRAMMSYGPGRGNNLAFCTTTASTHWTRIGHLLDPENEFPPREDVHPFNQPDFLEDDKACYHDFVYSSTHKLFFCITDNNHLQAWDLRHPPSPRNLYTLFTGELNPGEHKINHLLHKSKVIPEYWHQSHLVIHEPSDRLFAVSRYIMTRVGDNHTGYVRPLYYGAGRGFDDSYPYKTIGFDVNEIEGWDDDKCTTSRRLETTYLEDSLDGLVMFVGLNHSFALSTDEFPGLKPNSIYFTDVLNDFTPQKRVVWAPDGELPPKKWADSRYGGHHLAIFDYGNRTFSPCYYPCDVESVKRIMPPPLWFTSH